MSSPVIDIKINAIIEGLDLIKRLQAEIASLGSVLGTIAASSTTATSGLDRVDAATDAAAASTANAAKETREFGDVLDAQGRKMGSLGAGTGAAAEGLGSIGSAAQGAAPALANMADSADDSNKNLAALKNPVDEVTGKIKALVASIIAFVAVASLKDAADLAARVELLGVTLNVVGQNAGYGKDQLSAYQTELEALGITTEGARNGLIQMINAGLELGPVAGSATSQVARLARAAQDLAVVVGGNSSDTFQQLIINIQQLDTQGFRSMGITLDVQKAQEKFALSLGKTSDSLTQQQKVQAVTNAALEKAAGLTGAYEESLQSVGKQLQSLSRYQDQFALALGDQLLPAYGALITASREFLKENTDVINSLGDNSRVSTGLADLMKSLADATLGVFSFLIQESVDASEGFGMLATAVSEVIGLLSDLATDGTSNAEAAFTLGDLIGEVFKAAAVAVAAVVDGLQILRMGLLETVGIVDQVLGAFVSSLGALVSTVFPETGAAIEELGNKLTLMGDKQRGSAQQIVKDFEAGNTALGNVLSTVNETTKALTSLDGIGGSTKFSEMSEQVRNLTASQRQNTLTSTELAKGTDLVTAALERAKTEGGLTEKQIARLSVSIAGIKSKAAAEFNDALSNMGTSLKDLEGGTTEAAGKIIGGLQTIATNSETTADQFAKLYDRGVDSAETVQDLGKVIETIDQFGIRSKESADAAALSQEQLQERLAVSSDKLNELTDAGLKTAKTASQFDDLSESVKKVGDQLVKAGVLSQAELDAKLLRIADAAVEAKARLESLGASDALKGLGLSLLEITTGVSDAVEAATQYFDQLRTSGTLTADQMYTSFSKKIDIVKSLEDLNQFRQSVVDAGKDGTLFGQAYDSALQLVAEKFQTVFAAQLGAAKTKEDFDLLKASAIAMGQEGSISATQLATSLDQIREKASGARESILTLSQQSLDASSAQLKVTQAQTAAYTAGIAVQTAQNDVAKAQATFAKEGTESARLQLVAKQADLALARERYALARQQAQVESASYDVLIAKQTSLNALKAAEYAEDKGAAQALIAATQRDLEGKTLVLNRTQEAVNEQQGMVAQTEAAARAAHALADEMAQTEANAKGAAEAAAGIGSGGLSLEGLTFLSHTVGSLTARFLEMGFTAEESARKAEEAFKSANSRLANGNKLLGGGWDGQVTNYNYAEEMLKKAAGLKEKADARDEAAAKLREQELQRQSDKADQLGESYKNIATAAEDAALKTKGISIEANSLANELGPVGDKMKGIAKEAQGAASGAIDAANSFVSSNQSIQEQLYNAQGRADLAIKSQYDSKKQSLALDYEMLKVRIQTAQVEARAAGVDTSGLDNALANASTSYANALKNLDTLQNMDLEKAAAKVAPPTGATATGLEASATRQVSNALGSALVQSIASPEVTRPSATSVKRATPEKVIQLNLNAGGKTVSLQTESSNSGVLDMVVLQLENAMGRS